VQCAPRARSGRTRSAAQAWGLAVPAGENQADMGVAGRSLWRPGSLTVLKTVGTGLGTAV